MVRWMGGWKDDLLDRQMARWPDGQVKKWTDGEKEQREGGAEEGKKGGGWLEPIGEL